MTRGRKKILSATERSGLADEKRDLESSLREAEGYGAGTAASGLDKAAIKRQIDHLDKAIHEGMAPKVSGSKKDIMYKEAMELKERFTKDMPTKYEMDNPAKCPGAVHKHLNWDRKTQPDRDRYREIMRTLEPNDPTATDVEKYRREK